MRLTDEEQKEIEELEVSRRIQNILIRNAIAKNQFFSMSLAEILNIRGIGETMINEIIVLFKKNQLLDSFYKSEKELLKESKKIVINELYKVLNISNKEISTFIKEAIKSKVTKSSKLKIERLKCELFKK